MQLRPSNAKPDCEEKRDPDIRSLIIHKKENELDPDTQLEKRPFAAGARSNRVFEAKQTSSLVTFAGFPRLLRYIGVDFTLRLKTHTENEAIAWAILKSKMRVFELRI